MNIKYEKMQLMQEHKRKNQQDNDRNVFNTTLAKFGDTYIAMGKNDSKEQIFKDMICTQSSFTMDAFKKKNDSDDSDDDELDLSIEETSSDEEDPDKKPYKYMEWCKEDAKEKRNDLRETLMEWKETIDQDELASVDPLIRQERMRELAKQMLEEGMI